MTISQRKNETDISPNSGGNSMGHHYEAQKRVKSIHLWTSIYPTPTAGVSIQFVSQMHHFRNPFQDEIMLLSTTPRVQRVFQIELRNRHHIYSLSQLQLFMHKIPKLKTKISGVTNRSVLIQ